MGVKLSEMSFSELAGIVNTWPWFAAARKELAIRSGRAADAALYVCSRRLLNVPGVIPQPPQKEIREVIDTAQDRKVIVIGGDFFSQEQYDSVRKAGDDIFPSFAAKAGETTENRKENMPATVPRLWRKYMQNRDIRSRQNTFIRN